MSTTFDALSPSSLLRVLAVFQFKKDIPEALQGMPLVRINFGLYGLWYAVKSFGGLRMKDGQDLPVHFAHLYTGAVVGVRDLEAARGTKHADGWRESYAACIAERLQLHGMNR